MIVKGKCLGDASKLFVCLSRQRLAHYLVPEAHVLGNLISCSARPQILAKYTVCMLNTSAITYML